MNAHAYKLELLIFKYYQSHQILIMRSNESEISALLWSIKNTFIKICVNNTCCQVKLRLKGKSENIKMSK